MLFWKDDNLYIKIPYTNYINEGVDCSINNNLVLVGANGSGKTRFGAYIEEYNSGNYHIHRISAQKSLTLPNSVKPSNLENAKNNLYYGRSDGNYQIIHKKISRWNKNLVTTQLNDYEKLIILLFAKENVRNSEYVNKSRKSTDKVDIPESYIDQIINIWPKIMPQREIRFDDGKILVKDIESEEYNGQEMSDGERVALYLIGQCICTPKDAIIIIDEPEIHLHKSIIDRLWNNIEFISPNKKFIYITHNIDFATSRKDAKIIWLKGYKHENRWDYEYIESDNELPDNLKLEVLGSRKDVIFVEGEKGSLDYTIYQLVYKDYHIIPRGGGDQVIEATKGMNNNSSLHHLKAYGIVDSDYKEAEEKKNLKNINVECLEVAEIENLICRKEIIKVIADHLGYIYNEILKKVIDFIIEGLNKELELQITNKTEKIIEYKLGAYSKTSNNKQGLKNALTNTTSNIDIDAIYNNVEIEFRNAMETRNFDKLLLIYNRKSLVKRIGMFMGLKDKEYELLVVRLLKSDKKEDLIDALKTILPEFN